MCHQQTYLLWTRRILGDEQNLQEPYSFCYRRPLFIEHGLSTKNNWNVLISHRLEACTNTNNTPRARSDFKCKILKMQEFKWLTTHVVVIYTLSLEEVNIAKAAASECLSLLGVCASVHPWQKDNPLHWAPWGWKLQHNKQWEPFTSHFSQAQTATAGWVVKWVIVHEKR